MYACIFNIDTSLGAEESPRVGKVWLSQGAPRPNALSTHKNHAHMKHTQKFQGTKIEGGTIWPHKNRVK